MFDEFYEKPYYVIDFLPEQVPEGSEGQFFAIEKYYLKQPQRGELQKRFLDILLKLNCYYDFEVWPLEHINCEINPAPEVLEELMMRMEEVLNIFLPSANSLIVTQPEDLYMTVYNPDEKLLELLQQLVLANGLFVWKPGNLMKDPLLEKAMKLAKEQFTGRVDKAGVDYYSGHLCSVASLVDCDEEKIVAFLHDILEDTDYPEVKLREQFGDRIVDAICLLTHREKLTEEGYLDYIQQLKDSGNELAIAVKKADLTNNSDFTRLGATSLDDLSPKDRKRWEKYQKSLDILNG